MMAQNSKVRGHFSAQGEMSVFELGELCKDLFPHKISLLHVLAFTLLCEGQPVGEAC